MHTSILKRCAEARDAEGLFGVLKALNATTSYRFTGIYRFDDRWVRSVWLYDRENPDIQFGSDVLWDDSYCRLTATEGDACEIVNALDDTRLMMHAARERVQSYVAVLLRTPDKGAFGTLCHYDVCPGETAPDVFATLREARDLVEDTLWRQLGASV